MDYTQILAKLEKLRNGLQQVRNGDTSQEIQDEITKKSNDFVSKNLEIAISVDDHGMHHWICDEIRTLCTGTHVKNTSEIGTIFILFEKKNDNTTRVLVKTSE